MMLPVHGTDQGQPAAHAITTPKPTADGAHVLKTAIPAIAPRPSATAPALSKPLTLANAPEIQVFSERHISAREPFAVVTVAAYTQRAGHQWTRPD